MHVYVGSKDSYPFGFFFVGNIRDGRIFDRFAFARAVARIAG